jgi:autotransporter-associated beta strand protein
MGTKVLSGTNTYTGITAVTGGKVRLDYTVNNTSKFADGSALELGWNGAGVIQLLGADSDVPSGTYFAGMSGANIELVGAASANPEIVLSTNLNVGASYLSRPSGLATMRLNAITRAVGGTLDLNAAGLADTDTLNTNGIVGGGSITVGRSTWGVNSTNAADGAITGLATFSNDTYAASNNVDVVAFTAISAASIANTLRFNQPAGGTLSVNNVLGMTAGGLLMTPASGNVIINGTGSATM